VKDSPEASRAIAHEESFLVRNVDPCTLAPQRVEASSRHSGTHEIAALESHQFAESDELCKPQRYAVTLCAEVDPMHVTAKHCSKYTRRAAESGTEIEHLGFRVNTCSAGEFLNECDSANVILVTNGQKANSGQEDSP
jgi:hypothetical protein